jgi:hypothetical protein
MTQLPSLPSRYKAHLPLLAGLLLIAPVFFFQAFRYSLPLGYAGMFTQMAEQIAAANFALPLEIPHYGPGGIPFVYPPLAHYIFAIAIKLGLSTWAYLRLVPAIFTLLAFIPFYFLARELTGARIGALAAMLLAATAPTVYHTHVWAAGVVRGLALALCLAGLLFYLRALREFSWRDFALAGLSLGLLLTTHLLYVAFAAVFGIACLLAEWKPRRTLTALGILALALLAASPWLGLVIARHGVESLLAAASSHRNADFFSLLFRDFGAALAFLGGNLEHVSGNWFLAALALPGLVLLLARKQFHLPLALLLVLLMGEASFYSVIVAAMMAGAFVEWAFQQSRAAIPPGLRPDVNIRAMPARPAQADFPFARLALAALTALAILLALGKNLSEVIRYEPEIDVYSLQMAKFVRHETSPAETYLYIGRINEAEWFPYLLDRTPVFALWGSEWKGTYAEQLQILVDLRACQGEKDWGCMEALLRENNANPDLLIAPNQRWLFQQIKDTRAWELIYEDERYQVWEKRP